MSLIAQLDGAELARVRFHLECDDAFAIDTATLLRLRRVLLRAARWAVDASEPAAEAMLQLLDVPPPVDPLVRRRVQKPSPPFAFVMSTQPVLAGEAGDEWLLEVVLPGNAVSTASLLARLLQRVGAVGLTGEGPRFELCMITACGHDGVWSTGWQQGAPLGELALPLLNLRWLIEEHLATAARRLQFVTPARLLHHGKPLFVAGMAEIAPFMLRRVTSVLASAIGIEPFAEADSLLASLRAVEPLENGLEWKDWRTLDRLDGSLDLGGIAGHLLLPETLADDERILLYLASLFNIGRGASFGAGHFRLDVDR